MSRTICYATIHLDFSTREDAGSDWTPWMMILKCVAMPLYMFFGRNSWLHTSMLFVWLEPSAGTKTNWSFPLGRRKHFCLWVFMVDIKKNHWWRWFWPKKPAGDSFFPDGTWISRCLSLKSLWWVFFWGGSATLECQCLFHPGWFLMSISDKDDRDFCTACGSECHWFLANFWYKSWCFSWLLVKPRLKVQDKQELSRGSDFK